MTPRPFGLLAELTHRCPLRCPYCSNPTALSREEIDTQTWIRVLHEAAALGVLHVFFSGGESLLRRDLERLVAAARSAGLYTNLITSTVGLTRERLHQLQDAGLDSVQVSLQAADAATADAIAGLGAGAAAHLAKLEAARWVVELGLPLTLNVVLHRDNIDQLPALIALAEALGAQRLELANVQFYGWAFENRTRLLPARAQLDTASALALAAQQRLRGRIEVLYVLPDHHGDRPKPCMQGWGARQLTVDPRGDVLPCPTARAIADLRFDNVRDRALTDIWSDSQAFTRFRGTAWLPEPCHSCERREIDFGGCRCQAALLTGDPAVTDPACALSPHHDRIVQIVAQAEQRAREPVLTPLRYRQNPR